MKRKIFNVILIVALFALACIPQYLHVDAVSTQSEMPYEVIEIIDSVNDEDITKFLIPKINEEELSIPLEDSPSVLFTGIKVQSQKPAYRLVNVVKYFSTPYPPSTIYYDYGGYWGYLSRGAVFKDLSRPHVTEAHYHGVVYRKGPGAK